MGAGLLHLGERVGESEYSLDIGQIIPGLKSRMQLTRSYDNFLIQGKDLMTTIQNVKCW